MTFKIAESDKLSLAFSEAMGNSGLGKPLGEFSISSAGFLTVFALFLGDILFFILMIPSNRKDPLVYLVLGTSPLFDFRMLLSAMVMMMTLTQSCSTHTHSVCDKHTKFHCLNTLSLSRFI